MSTQMAQLFNSAIISRELYPRENCKSMVSRSAKGISARLWKSMLPAARKAILGWPSPLPIWGKTRKKEWKIYLRGRAHLSELFSALERIASTPSTSNSKANWLKSTSSMEYDPHHCKIYLPSKISKKTSQWDKKFIFLPKKGNTFSIHPNN